MGQQLSERLESGTLNMVWKCAYQFQNGGFPKEPIQVGRNDKGLHVKFFRMIHCTFFEMIKSQNVDSSYWVLVQGNST